MRFSTRAPAGEQPWVRWFAWYPVVTGKTNEYSWLEYVERKKCYEFEYHMNAGNAVGSEYYRAVLAKFEQELIMRGFI